VRFLLLFLIIINAAGIFPDNAFAQADLTVNSLRIGTHPDKTRIVASISRKTDFRAFMLFNPPRLVLDLPAFDWQAGTPASPPGSLTGSVRYGILQQGISRIVIDLKKPSTLKSAFFLPAGPSVQDRIVLDLAALPPGQGPAQERMFGTLTSHTPQLQLQPVMKKETEKPASEKETARAVPAPPAPAPFAGNEKKAKPVIVIDAGHGGQDPGAKGANGKQEKDVTLAAAKDLKRALEETGRYRVHLTRSDDYFIKLQDRVKIGRKHGADLFISLHADSIDKPDVSGASIYTLSNKASDAQTAKLAARENRADLIAGVDLSHEDKEVADILIDLAMRDTMNQSKFFANLVVGQAKRQGIQLLEKPHRFAGFAVLKAPDVPSVLIEMGFMSNKAEVDRLSSVEYRRRISAAVAQGIDAYFAKVRK
jgi:N-acetylmuramoyl-L-alanine amidase